MKRLIIYCIVFFANTKLIAETPTIIELQQKLISTTHPAQQGEIHYAIAYHIGDPKDSLFELHVENAVKIGLRESLYELVGKAYFLQGEKEYDIRSYWASYYAFEKSLHYYSEIQNTEFTAYCHEYLARILAKTQLLSLANEHLDAALTLQIARKDNKALSNHYFFQAVHHFEINDFEKARSYITLALELSQHKNQQLSSMLNWQGRIEVTAGNPQQGLEIYKSALPIAQEENQVVEMAWLFNNIGIAYRDLNQLDSAQFYINKAIILANEFDLLYQKVHFLVNVVQLKLLTGYEAEAIQQFVEIAELSPKLNDHEEVLRGYQLIKDLLKKGSYTTEWMQIADEIQRIYDLREAHREEWDAYQLRKQVETVQRIREQEREAKLMQIWEQVGLWVLLGIIMCGGGVSGWLIIRHRRRMAAKDNTIQQLRNRLQESSKLALEIFQPNQS